MNTNRDNFNLKTKNDLAARVGYKCSNPHCRRLTVGPGKEPKSSVNVGIAAHICAAAPNGPRYDRSMTIEERSSINNGIWLCSFCANLIDKDVARYSIELLCQWKNEAEKDAEYQIHSTREIHTANLQYTNSFLETLFLHKNNQDSRVNLKNLFVMQNYIDLREKREDGQYTLRDDLKDGIANFIQNTDTEMLFISGSGGSGKTTLVAWLNYHYAANDSVCKEVFGDKTLITIRLRDLDKKLIAEKNSLIPAIRQYLQIPSLDELNERYPNSIMILDGFDELCMIENLSSPQRLINDLYRKRLKGFKYIITSRPKYLNIQMDFSSMYYSIQHFGLEQITEWLRRYTASEYCNEKIDAEIIKYLVNMDENSLSVICDTPMNLYMLVSKKADHLLVNNSWALYRHIFYNEMSETEYNKMFPDPDYNYAHDISILKDVLYQISEEIAYKMYQCGNEKFYLKENELKAIIEDLSKANPILEKANMKEIASHCYALCCYWKEYSEKGAVEFLHNDIRDFFFAEKIYRQFNNLYEDYSASSGPDIATIVEMLCCMFPYGVLETKVAEFLLLRSTHHKSNALSDFAAKEYKNPQIGNIVAELFTNRKVYAHVFVTCDHGYPIDIIENIITCTIQVYRHVLEPYCNSSSSSAKRLNFLGMKLLFNDVYAHSFSKIFRQVPVTLSTEHMLPLASRWNFQQIKLTCQDLRNIGFQNSNLVDANLSDCILSGCDFTGAILAGSVLTNADIHYACLRNTDLTRCDLIGADLRGTELPDGFCSIDQNEQVAHLRQLNIPDLKI